MVGKRYSKQRELIYQCLMSTEEHPTAETIYTKLKAEHPNLSLGTVYRNLNLLADEGVAARMPFAVDRYDGNVVPHAHFRCTTCGAVSDLMELNYDGMRNQEVAVATGHVVEHHEVIFSGTCKDCVCKH